MQQLMLVGSHSFILRVFGFMMWNAMSDNKPKQDSQVDSYAEKSTRAESPLIKAARAQAGRSSQMSSVGSEEFLQRVLQSGVLTDAESDRVRNLYRQDLPAKSFATELIKRRLLTHWQATNLLRRNMHLRMRKYVLLDKLASGGMGTVLRAKDLKLKRQVAVKILSSHLLMDEKARERFVREIQLLASLEHPNIVSAIDAGTVSGRSYLVMDLVSGDTLATYIKHSSPLDIAWCCECIHQSFTALRCIDDAGLVHRDLKPSNLIVSQRVGEAQGQEFVVKILDLGLARYVDSAGESNMTQTNQIMGTPDFMSPEQAENAHRVDIRSDIFSLGCTMFALLTGRPPFAGSTYVGKLLARCRHDAPPVRELRADVPPALEHVLGKMLAREPKNRFQTPEEAADAILPFTQEADFESTFARLQSGLKLVPETESDDDPKLEQFLDHLRDRRSRTTEIGSDETSPNPSENVSEPQEEVDPLPEATEQPYRWTRLVAAVCLVAILLAGWLAVTIGTGSGENDPEESEVASTDSDQQQSGEDGGELPPFDGDGTGTGSEGDPGLSNFLPPLDIPQTPAPVEKVSDAAKQPVAVESKPKPPPPKTLVVGHEEGQHSTLERALVEFVAGDTIIVRKRAVTLPPIDLSEKSPVTIRGDKNWWPIVIGSSSSKTSAGHQYWLHGENLDLTLEGIRLVLPSNKDVSFKSWIGCDAGKIRFNHCLVQCSVDGPLTVAEPIPLVTSGGAGPISLSLSRTFVRGSATSGLLHTNGCRDCNVSLEETVWATSAGDLLRLDGSTSQFAFSCSQSTLYNLESLIRFGESFPFGEADVTLSLESSIISGTYANKAHLLALPAKSPTLPQAVQEGRFHLQGGGTQFHSFAAGLARGDQAGRGLSIARWNLLHSPPAVNEDRIADPGFGVRPRGYELELTTLWDLRPRGVGKARRKTTAAANAGSPRIGPSAANMPPDEWISFKRPIDRDLATKVYEKARVLTVGENRAEYVSLTDAFEDARDRDIIEIVDSRIYRPSGNPKKHSHHAALWTGAPRITVRSADGAQPIILLNETIQRAIPKPSWYSLLEFGTGYELTLDGLTLGFQGKCNDSSRLISVGGIGRFIKITNCTFLELDVKKGASKAGTVGAYSTTPFLWMENNVHWSRGNRSMLASSNAKLLLRNCLMIGGGVYWDGGSQFGRLQKTGHVTLEKCTIGNHPLLTIYLADDSACHFECIECLALAKTSPFVLTNPAVLERITYQGQRNVFSGPRHIATIRDGPPVSMKEWRQRWNGDNNSDKVVSSTRMMGESRTNAPYRPFTVFGRETASTYAADDKAVGVRTQYLPLPAKGVSFR